MSKIRIYEPVRPDWLEAEGVNKNCPFNKRGRRDLKQHCYIIIRRVKSGFGHLDPGAGKIGDAAHKIHHWGLIQLRVEQGDIIEIQTCGKFLICYQHIVFTTSLPPRNAESPFLTARAAAPNWVCPK